MRTLSISEGSGITPDVASDRDARVQYPSVRPARAGAEMPLFVRIFSFPIMLASLLVGSVFAAVRGFRVDPDLWWHIKVGDSILATHHWPTIDMYSFTVTGQPWLAYEWVGEVLLAVAQRIGGISGLEVVLVVLASAVVLSLYGLAALCSGNSKAGFVAASILLPLATVSFTLRPQMLGYLFLILTLIALERLRQGKRAALWFVPLLMLLWVNTHGSWIVGLGTIFVYWISGLFDFRAGSLEATRWPEKDRRVIACVFLLSLIAVPMTPYGTRIAASPFEFAFSLPLNSAHITEWEPMPFDLAGGKLFLALFLAVILLQVACQFRWRVEQLVLFLFGAMMACLHVRFLLIFLPFFAPLLAVMLSRWMRRYNRNKDKFVLNAGLILCVAAGMIRYFPKAAELRQQVARQFPVVAIKYLEEHPVPGPMYNSYGFGGYLIWSRGPAHKVFIDGRGDVYERGGVLGDYLHIANLMPGALSVLDEYDIQSCLIQRDEALATALSSSPRWKRIYFDNVSALFVRARTDEAHP